MSIPVLIVLVMFIESTLHYFPWREILRGKKLPRQAAYILGVAGMMLPFSVWLFENNQLGIIKVLWMVILGAGLSVLLCYLIDWVVGLVWKLDGSIQRENILKDVIDATQKGQD